MLVVLAALAELAESLGFEPRRAFELSLALREIGGNVVRHAKSGHAELRSIENRDRAGIELVVSDGGPGIEDIEAALRDGFSTKGTLGIGLGAARRLVDEFRLESTPHAGTRVRMVKWATAPR